MKKKHLLIETVYYSTTLMFQKILDLDFSLEKNLILNILSSQSAKYKLQVTESYSGQCRN